MAANHLKDFLKTRMKHRKLRNWSHLAEEIDESPQLVSKWVAGSVTISRPGEEALIRVLKLSAAQERELGRLIRAADAARRKAAEVDA